MAKATTEKTATEFKNVKVKDHVISKKRSGRFLVTGPNGKVVNGAEKTKFLLDAKLISAGTPKAAPEAAPSA